MKKNGERNDRKRNDLRGHSKSFGNVVLIKVTFSHPLSFRIHSCVRTAHSGFPPIFYFPSWRKKKSHRKKVEWVGESAMYKAKM